MTPKEKFIEYVTKAVSKDAALSAFDRDMRAGKLDDPAEWLNELKKIFQPIREERINRRKIMDIGGVADKKIFRVRDVVHNIKWAKYVLDNPVRPDEVLLALLLMTGRRTAEIVGSTQFRRDKFIGTIKGGKESGEARYLCSFERILKGLNYLNKVFWRPVSVSKANQLCAVPLMRKLQLLRGVDKVHDLRKMHMAIWLRRLRKRKTLRQMSPEQRSEFIGRFVNNALGHTNPSSALPYLNCEIK
jgi:hypothetical protein